MKTITGFKKIIIFEAKSNKGLAKSIISGVSQILENYPSVIVLEDDLITTPNFLDFINQALVFFESNSEIYSINGYSLEQKKINPDSNYLHYRSFPWGWATWKKSWDINFFDKEKIIQIINNSPNLLKEFKSANGNDVKSMLQKTLKGQLSSWYIRWVFSNYIKGNKSLFPALSKVENIGHSSQATHYSGGISAYKCDLDKSHLRKFDFSNTVDISNSGNDFLKFFSKRYKMYYRLKLMTRLDGVRMIINEIYHKLLR